jgi:hypothetical protein
MAKIQNILNNMLRLNHFGDDLLASMSFGNVSELHRQVRISLNYSIINQKLSEQINI